MGANIRKDLFGIIDLIAIGPGQIIGVQSTSYGCRKDHVNKIYGDKLEETLAWLESKADLLLVCWKKVPKGRSFRYEPVIERITPDGPMEMRFQSTHK